MLGFLIISIINMWNLNRNTLYYLDSLILYSLLHTKNGSICLYEKYKASYLNSFILKPQSQKVKNSYFERTFPADTEGVVLLAEVVKRYQ